MDLIPGGGATADNVTVDIEPRTLMVAGSAEILDQLDRISLGEIDLSKVFGTLTQSMTINLDPSLTNVSGITEAKVTVTVEGLVTKTLEAGNIEIVNKPGGYEITRNTQSCTVLIRGTQEAVDAVTASQVRIVADLSNLDRRTQVKGWFKQQREPASWLTAGRRWPSSVSLPAATTAPNAAEAAAN